MISEHLFSFSKILFIVAGVVAALASLQFLARGSVKRTGIEISSSSKAASVFSAWLALGALAISALVEIAKVFGLLR